MKKNSFLISIPFLILTACFLFFSGRVLRAEDAPFKVLVLPDQNSVKPGMMFLVSARVVNSSTDSSTGFWANNCSYEKHWVADDPRVRIQPWTCDENALEQITLDPGGVYEKSIILYVSGMDKSGPLTFRMGFKAMSENGDVAEPVWGDPVTMEVIVSDDMKEAGIPMVPARSHGLDGRSSKAAPVAGPNVASQVTDPAPASTPAVPSEMTEAASAAVSGSVAPAGNEPLVFRDPGVFIKVRPGDEFSIALVSNPSTGFRWRMTLPQGGKAVSFLGSTHVVSDDVMPGVPGTEVFKFKATAEGETKADFVYERPWEPKIAPTRKIFTILVEKA
jgi:predicted secreted protein